MSSSSLSTSPPAGQPTTTTGEPTTVDYAAETAAAEKEAYEAQFASKSVSQQATSYDLFSNPNRFSINYIHGSTHYLTKNIEGRIWLDVNGDGKRGDSANSTLQALEHDHGVGKVKIHMVHCESNELVSAREVESQGESGQGAGTYSFDLRTMESGRYYFMYQAPFGFRISGNVLPLDRNEPHYNCLPKGGEGDIYIKEAREKGDLDFRGYCARSIGCFQVDTINPHKKSNFDDFSSLVVLENDVVSPGAGVDYFKHDGNLAALPSEHFMNVGLAQEDWELPAYQYADAQITLTFASDVNALDLYQAVPDDFESSEVRAQLEASLAQFLGGKNGSSFSVSGVNIHGGQVGVVHQESETEAEDLESELAMPQDHFDTGKMRGMPGSTRRRVQAGTGQTMKQLTYTITARGSYRPPPHEELGPVVQDSINDDPQGLIKSLKDKEELPVVFEKAEDVSARRLSVKEVPVSVVKVKVIKIEAIETWQDIYFRWMDNWAIFPVIVLAGLIALLMGLFIFRRAFVRRAKKVVRQERKIILKEITAGEHNGRNLRKNDLRKSTLRKSTIKKSDSLIMSSAKAQEKKLFGRSFVDKDNRKASRRAAADEGTRRSLLRRSFFKRAPLEEDSRKFRRSSIHTNEDQIETDPKPELVDVKSMSVSQIKQELESYFIPTDTFVEKREMVEALSNAREGGLRCSVGTAATDSSPPVYSSFTTQNTAPTYGQEQHETFRDSLRTSSTSFSPNQSFTNGDAPLSNDRRQHIKQAKKSCKKLTVGQLKQELESLGISTSGFLEKRDMVRALAVARVDGAMQGEESAHVHEGPEHGRSSFGSVFPPRQFVDPFPTASSEAGHPAPPTFRQSSQTAPARNGRHHSHHAGAPLNVRQSFQTAPPQNSRHSFHAHAAGPPNVHQSFHTAPQPNVGSAGQFRAAYSNSADQRSFQVHLNNGRQSFQSAPQQNNRQSCQTTPSNNGRQSFQTAPEHNNRQTAPSPNPHNSFQEMPPQTAQQPFQTGTAWY